MKIVRHGLLRGARPAVRPGARLGPARRRASSSSTTSIGRGRRDRRRGRRSCVLAVAVLVLMTLSVAAPDPPRGPAPTAGRPAPSPCSASSGSPAPCSARRSCRACRSPPAARPPSPTTASPRCARACATSRRSPREAAVDAFRDTPGDQLLTGLRGKDVVLAFVESYGRSAVEDPEFAPQVGAVLDAGNRRLRAAGLRLAQRLAHLVDRRRRQLAGPLHAAVRAVDQQPAALPHPRRERPPHPQQRLPARGLADRRRHAGASTGPGRRASSTATTRSTHSRTSATRARASATPPCRTSTPCRPSQRPERATPGHAAGDGRDPARLQPRAVGAAARAWSTGTTSATARSTTRWSARRPPERAVWRDPARLRAAYRRPSSTR